MIVTRIVDGKLTEELGKQDLASFVLHKVVIVDRVVTYS